MNYEQKHRSDHDGWNQPACKSLDRQSAIRRKADRDRSRISLFTEQRPDQQDGAWQCYSRAEEEAESIRLISIAKEHSLYIDPSQTKRYGLLYSKKTGESKVYANEELGLVFKVHDPFAKRVLKDMHPCDAIYEHIIHNILFPNVRYNFVGITSENEDVRIVLSQEFCMASMLPTQVEIETHLASLGLLSEGYYYYGNEYLSVTDVSAESDNVLKDDEGGLFFIDPIIKLKKPAPVVIEWLLSAESPIWKSPSQTSNHKTIFHRILEFIKKLFPWSVRP